MFSEGSVTALLLVIAWALSLPAAAQDAASKPKLYLEPTSVCGGTPPANNDCGNARASETSSNFWNRETLTGDWFGARSFLEDSGVTFAARVTHFGFGVAGGVDRPVPPPLGQGDSLAYTGRGEYDLILDLDKLVGLPHGRLLVRAEHWFGQFGNVALRVGSFAPAVFPAALPPRPNDPGMPYLTNFLYTQPLSKKLVLLLGKRDVVGAHDQDAFAGGDGTAQFINQALIANPSFLLGLPYSSITAGAVSPQDWGRFSLFVWDAKDRTAEFFDFDTLFSKGVIVTGEVQVDTHFFGLPGQQHVGLIWGNRPLTDLRFGEPPPGEYPEPTLPGLPTLPSFYTLYHGWDQYFSSSSEGPNRGWGVFGRASISDGNPTPLRYFVSLGIGGDSPFGGERGDTFGIGWYFTGASTAFGPVPRLLFGPRNGTGVEIFYNFQVTPWLNITPDIQFISPGAGAIANDAFVYGLRVNTRL